MITPWKSTDHSINFCLNYYEKTQFAWHRTLSKVSGVFQLTIPPLRKFLGHLRGGILKYCFGYKPWFFSPAAGNLKEKTSFLAFSGHPLSIRIITFQTFFLKLKICWTKKDFSQLKLEVLCLTCSWAPQAIFWGFCGCLDAFLPFQNTIFCSVLGAKSQNFPASGRIFHRGDPIEYLRIPPP